MKAATQAKEEDEEDTVKWSTKLADFANKGEDSNNTQGHNKPKEPAI